MQVFSPITMQIKPSPSSMLRASTPVVGWVCPPPLVSWATIYDLAFRQAREAVARTQWTRRWEPSAN